MKDNLNNIDELFREKLGNSTGRYDAGLWARMAATLDHGGGAFFWRNIRNATMVVLLAAVVAIDFFIPKEATQYRPENTAIIIPESNEESFEEGPKMTATSSNPEKEENNPDPTFTNTKSNTGAAVENLMNLSKGEIDGDQPVGQNVVPAMETELSAAEEEPEPTVALSDPAEYIAEHSVAQEEKVEKEQAEEEKIEITEAVPSELAGQKKATPEEEDIDPLAAKDAAKRIFVGAMAYGGSAWRVVSSNNEALESRKESEEKPRLYYSGQSQLGYTFGNWSIITGFGQWTQKENLSYSNQLNGNLPVDNGYWDINSQTISTVDSSWVIVGIYQGYWNYDTTTVSYLDSTYITQWDTAFGAYDTTMAQNNGSHQLRYFEVPVIASYRMPLRKFDLEFSAGMSFGFFASSSGKTYLNEEQSAVFSSGEQNALFRSPVYSALMGVGITYPLSRHWEIALQAQGRYTLNSVVNNAVWNQRYLQYGLGAGVRYRF